MLMAARRKKKRPGAPRPAGHPRAQADRGRTDAPDEANITTLVLRAAFMDGHVYQVIRDRGSTVSALGVVIAVAVLYAIGQRTVEPGLLAGQHPILWFVLRLDFIVIGWLLWSAIAILFGRWIFGGDASRSEVMRALAIASAPGALLAFSELNVQLAGQTVGEALMLFGLLWMLAIGTQAIKETLRLNWFQAAVPGALGWLVGWLVILNLALFPAGDPPPEDPAPAGDSPVAIRSEVGLWWDSSHLPGHGAAPPSQHGKGV